MDILDIIGEIFWYAIFCTPLITIPLTVKYLYGKTWQKMLTGLYFAFVLSIVFFMVSMDLCLRNGLGPT